MVWFGFQRWSDVSYKNYTDEPSNPEKNKKSANNVKQMNVDWFVAFIACLLPDSSNKTTPHVF